jgi:predicted nucleotidyltransferase
MTGEDLRPFIVYRCRVGSHAFGLATDESDDDVRGIYLPPARLHWSLFKLPEQLEFAEEGRDEVYWEMEKFLTLALKANPNVLETLWTPLVLHADEIAQRLRDMRSAFLSRHIYKTYSGYVLSQFRRMANAFAKTDSYKAKHAMHLVRLLYSGIEALKSGEIRIDVAEHREELLAIRSGAWSFEQAKSRALDLDREFQEASRRTRLPEQPDYRQANEFLIWARRRMVDA